MESHVAVDLMLPPEAASAGEARRLLREALDGEPVDSLDAAEVAVSEIVTNALVHAGTPMHLRILLGDPAGLRVELGDGSPHLPHQREYSTVASTGRGLHVVGEVVDRWGAYPSGDGKVVWFEIAEEAYPEDVVALGSTHAGDEIVVELLNVPLLMHAAWQEHAAALLRELLLVRLENDVLALESHAAASEALNVLFEQIPAPDLGDHPEEIMASATEPEVSRMRIALRVPALSMPHFDALDSALGEAVELAEDGQLLSPPTQPEIQSMREWLCDQVLGQARGDAGAAWVSPTQAQPPDTSTALEWDESVVTLSDRALVAADDTNRIIAVSPSAVTALGFGDAGELVGQRLISIIPMRFHQAHIAGFTLHLVNGRSPLLGHRVAVPVIRADGSEVMVDAQIESVPLARGRRVFTAEFLF